MSSNEMVIRWVIYSKTGKIMKGRILGLVMAILSIACHQDESIGPPEFLYQHWQRIESRTANGRVLRPDPTRLNVVTFKPSGEYVYGFNGKQYTCCQPNRFVRQGNQLIFSTVAGGYASPECIYSLCAPYQPEQFIDSLSAQRLVLSVKSSMAQTVYQVVR